MEAPPNRVLDTVADADAGQIPVDGILKQPDLVPVTMLTPIAPMKLARHNIGDQFIPTCLHVIAPLHFCDPDVSLVKPTHEAFNLRLRRFEYPTPPGWVSFTHPEGSIYWYNNALQLVTDVNVSSQEMLQKVLQALKMFRERLENLPLDKVAPQLRASRGADEWHLGMKQWELFLGIDPRDPGEFRYYVADWEKECLFWVEDIPSNPLFSSTVLGLDLPATYYHLRIMLRYHFWLHVESFPAHRSLPEGSFTLLRTVLLYSANDRMTSVTSTVSYPTHDLRRLLKMLPEKQSDDPSCAPYITAIAARHWGEIWSHRINNLYGLPTVRLSRFESRITKSAQRRPIKLPTKVLCWVLLFNQPRAFYDKLHDIWVQKSVDQLRSLLCGLHEEWTNTSFMATVMLAANMSFLSIDKLDSVDLPLVAQTASVVSIILAMGSIVSGMLLVQRHRELEADTCIDGAEEASDYITPCASKRLTGLLGAACLFSAPRALFLWSLLLFVSGLLSFSFSRASRAFTPYIAVATAIVMLIILVQIWYFNTELSKSDMRSPWSQAEVKSKDPEWESMVGKELRAGLDKSKRPFWMSLCNLLRPGTYRPAWQEGLDLPSLVELTTFYKDEEEPPAPPTDTDSPPAPDHAVSDSRRGDTASLWRRRLVRLFRVRGRTPHPIHAASDVERGDADAAPLPPVPQIKRPAASHHPSAGLPARDCVPGARDLPRIPRDGQPAPYHPLRRSRRRTAGAPSTTVHTKPGRPSMY